MQILLESHGILGFIDGSRKCPTQFDEDSDVASVETDSHQIWKMHDRALMQLLIETLSSTAISYVIGYYREGFITCLPIFAKDKRCSRSSSTASVSFEDDNIVILALNGLPSDYNTFRCMVRGRENVLSLKDFRSQLIAEEATLEQTNSASPFVSTMMAQNQTFQGKALVLDEVVTMLVSMVPIVVSKVTTLVVTLSIVGLILRVEAEVAVIINLDHALNKFSLLLALAQSTLYSYLLSPIGNFSYQSKPPSTNLSAMHANFSSSSPHEQFWVVDTGATTHMTSDLSQLSLATPFSGSDTITTAGGSSLSISNIGSSILDVPHCSLQLKQDKITTSVLLKGLCRAGLYPIPFSLLQSNLQQASSFHKNHFCYLGQQVNTSLWHKRLGHPSNTITSALLRQSHISFSLDNSKLVCTTCLEGKLAKLPFPYPVVKSIKPLEVIHSNVWGPSPTLSVEGFRYYVSFIDECTRFTWIFPMINKVESDGGGEYLSNKFKPYSHPQQYRIIVRALQYLTFTRPDIAFSVNQACQFMHNPMESHVVAVKRILKYLKGTLDFGIHFQPGILNLHAYSNADWAGDPNDRHSVSGFIVYLGSSPISWAFKKQHTVSRSSTEAEYRALAIAAAELAWIRQLFCDLHHQCSNLMLGSSKPMIEGECKDINGPSLATCHKIKESSG
ncbi:unnamed protein product [Prunus armeniaca]